MTFEQRRNRKILHKLSTTRQGRQDWYVTAPKDMTVEEILKPGAWVRFANKMEVGARIEVVSEDFLLDMELRVISIRDGLVYVRPLRITEDTEARAAVMQEAAESEAAPKSAHPDEKLPVPDGYKVGFSPKGGYFVILRETKKQLYRGLGSYNIAARKAQEHAEMAAGEKAA